MYIFKIGNITLPIAPSKIEQKNESDNKTISLINTGEINILRPVRLKEFSFDALFPHQNYPFAIYDDNKFKPPAFYIEYFKKQYEKNIPLDFSIIRNTPKGELIFDTLIKVSIESYTIREDAQEGFDIWISFTLKEYRDYSTIRYIINNDNTAEQSNDRPLSTIKQEQLPSENSPKSYTVVKGDNLWSICKRHYGDGLKYKEIAKNNSIANPNLIYPGQVIRLD